MPDTDESEDVTELPKVNSYVAIFWEAIFQGGGGGIFWGAIFTEPFLSLLHHFEHFSLKSPMRIEQSG